MNWALLRNASWVDTRARFVSRTPRGGTLLDLGSSDGETLNHFAELRPDLRLFAVDRAGSPERYPPNCQFHRADLENSRLPWNDSSMDAVTCLQLVEHLHDTANLLRECARLLKPGGRAFFETPHPRTLTLASIPGGAAGTFTMNFFDDPTHVKIVPVGALAKLAQNAGLEPEASGTSRNWLFAGAHWFYRWLPPSRKRFTAQVHWLGWSAYLAVRRRS